MPQRTAIQLTTCALLALAAISPPTNSRAETVEEFYSNNNLTILVPFNPGGGIDLYARLLAGHIGRHIPGNPTVIVQNKPGAAGIVGVNYLYNVAPKDGSHIGTMTPPNAFAPLFGKTDAEFDPSTLEWIGTMARDTPSCVVSEHSDVQTVSDLREKEAIFGSTGYEGMTAQHPFALRNVLGLKLDVVIGYPGTRDIWVAMERGEVDGVCAIWASLVTGPLADSFKEGKMRPLVQLGSRKEPVFGDAPLVYDLAESEADRAVLRFVFGQTEATRPYFAPPGVPADRLEALRAAFESTMEDPAFLREAEEAKVIIDPMTAEETEAAFEEVLSAPPEVIERAKEAMARPESD